MFFAHLPVLGEWGDVGIVRCSGILQANDRTHTFRLAQGQIIDCEGAEIEASKHGLVLADIIEQTQQVTRNMGNIVGLWRRRCFGLPHATHIGGNHAITGGRQCSYLPVPAKPKVRKAVAQHNSRTLPLLHKVHVDTVDRGVVMSPVHGYTLAQTKGQTNTACPGAVTYRS